MNSPNGTGLDPSHRREALLGLVWTLIRTDFKSRYHGSLGGFFWALSKPAAMFLVLYAIFSLIFSSDPDYRLNLVLGLFFWDFFAESTKAGLAALHVKGFLLTKARFPTWVLVVVSSSNALIALTVFSVILVLVVGPGHPLGLIAVPLYLGYLVAFLMIVTGISLATSVLFLRFRDLNQVWDVVLQAGFFVAPIIYPLDILPQQIHFFLYVWPPTPVIQFAREVVVAGTIPTLKAHLYLAGMALAILTAGVLIFRHHAPRAAEHL